MNGRTLAAIGVLAAWGAGLAAFAQREAARSPRDRLAEAATRIAPGAIYFAVDHDGRHAGFASSTIDTVPSGLQATDYLVVDRAVNGAGRRTRLHSVAHLSRGLVLRDFTITVDSTGRPVTVAGRVAGDTLLELVTSVAGSAADTSWLPLSSPLLLPSLIPFAVALGSRPEVGSRHELALFDPQTMSVRRLQASLAAESLFVVVDSAVYDAGSRRWHGVHADSVRGWRLVEGGGGPLDIWIDEQGRTILVPERGGTGMRRTAYEVAFENWRTASAAPLPRAALREERGASLVGAGVTIAGAPIDTIHLRLPGLDLSRVAIAGGQLRFSGDTVTIVREVRTLPITTLVFPPHREVRRRFARWLRAEPLLETEEGAIVALATRLRNRDRRADVVVRRIAAWVRDSVATTPTEALPSAMATLRSRAGDANGHAQLFVALARAAGIPARTVSGVVLVDGAPYYHAWSEAFLQRWTAIDPTLGRLPADAGYLRMHVGAPTMQREIERLLGGAGVRPVRGTGRPR